MINDNNNNNNNNNDNNNYYYYYYYYAVEFHEGNSHNVNKKFQHLLGTLYFSFNNIIIELAFYSFT